MGSCKGVWSEVLFLSNQENSSNLPILSLRTTIILEDCLRPNLCVYMLSLNVNTRLGGFLTRAHSGSLFFSWLPGHPSSEVFFHFLVSFASLSFPARHKRPRLSAYALCGHEPVSSCNYNQYSLYPDKCLEL